MIGSAGYDSLTVPMTGYTQITRSISFASMTPGEAKPRDGMSESSKRFSGSSKTGWV
jgi:hypothetical protein